MRVRSVAGGLVLLALAGSPADADQIAVGIPTAHLSPRQRRVERVAAGLFARALTEVLAAHPRCMPQEMRTFTHAPPSARVLGSVGLLRRPATAADRVPPDLLPDLTGDRIQLDATRVVHGPDDMTYYVVPSQGGKRLAKPSRACDRLVHARLEHLIAKRPRSVRRAAHRLARVLARPRWPKPVESRASPGSASPATRWTPSRRA
jgi:hypothetical protein